MKFLISFMVGILIAMPVLVMAATEANLYTFTMKTVDGEAKQLEDYKGKALLIVNTASKCGYTPQYGSLEKLYQQYKGRGFEILAFPANNFGNQEPGNEAEIKKFCTANYGITFPLFAKISVKGSDAHPLYQYLTNSQGVEGPVTWNFNKFLISPDGQIVARFGSATDPLEPALVKQLEQVLPKG